jgi:hypothetical protein
MTTAFNCTVNIFNILIISVSLKNSSVLIIEYNEKSGRMDEKGRIKKIP